MTRPLTQPLQVKPNMSVGHPRSRGLLNPIGHALSKMAAILDSMPSFGFRFGDVIGSISTHILLPGVA